MCLAWTLTHFYYLALTWLHLVALCTCLVQIDMSSIPETCSHACVCAAPKHVKKVSGDGDPSRICNLALDLGTPAQCTPSRS
jgi:hypothetical protein